MAIWKREVYISHHRTGKIKIYSRFKCKKINHILKDYTEQFFYIIIVGKAQQWLKINKAWKKKNAKFDNIKIKYLQKTLNRQSNFE